MQKFDCRVHQKNFFYVKLPDYSVVIFVFRVGIQPITKFTRTVGHHAGCPKLEGSFIVFFLVKNPQVHLQSKFKCKTVFQRASRITKLTLMPLSVRCLNSILLINKKSRTDAKTLMLLDSVKDGPNLVKETSNDFHL